MSLLNQGGQGGEGNQGEGGGQGGQQQGQQQSQSGGSQGGSGTSWRDSLPDELKNDTALQQFTDITGLAKSYLSTKSMVGKKGVIVPGQNASDEEWGAFYKSIGQPELDKFEMKTPEGKKVNTEVISKFKEMAHKAGLLPKQAQGILDWYLGTEEEAVNTLTTNRKAELEQKIEALKKEWGMGFDKQLTKAEFAAKELGIMEYLSKTGLNMDADIVKALAKVGDLYGEDKIRGAGGGGFGKTPAEIQKEIDNVMGNKEHPYWNRNHPSHKSATAEMEARFKSLAGG